MSLKDPDAFIPVNQILNVKPSLGPVPGEQVLPWGIICAFSFLITSLFGIGLQYCFFMMAWGIGTWWALTGREGWRFLSKFKRPPLWTIGQIEYKSALNPLEKNGQ